MLLSKFFCEGVRRFNHIYIYIYIYICIKLCACISWHWTYTDNMNNLFVIRVTSKTWVTINSSCAALLYSALQRSIDCRNMCTCNCALYHYNESCFLTDKLARFYCFSIYKTTEWSESFVDNHDLYSTSYWSDYSEMFVEVTCVGWAEGLITCIEWLLQPFKDEAQTALFKDPVCTAL